MRSNDLGGFVLLAGCNMNPTAATSTGIIATTSLPYLTTSPMTPAYDGTGIAVDVAGTVYVSASLDLNIGAVFEFPADASGSVTPSKIISSGEWGENAGGLALY